MIKIKNPGRGFVHRKDDLLLVGLTSIFNVLKLKIKMPFFIPSSSTYKSHHAVYKSRNKMRIFPFNFSCISKWLTSIEQDKFP